MSSRSVCLASVSSVQVISRNVLIQCKAQPASDWVALGQPGGEEATQAKTNP